MSKAKLAAICVLAVALLVGGITLAVTTRFRNNYESQIEALKAKGYPVTPAEFDAQPIADPDNAALVYEQIFQSKDKEFRDQLDGVMYQMGQSPTRGSPEQWAEARQCVAKCQPTVALLERAVAKPRCRFPRGWSLADMSSQKNAGMRRLAQFCYYRAKVFVHDGDMDEAVRSVDLGFKICHAFDEEPGFVGYAVQSAVAALANQRMYDVVKRDNLSERQARRLYNTLSGMDVDKSFKRAMTGELVMTITQAKETAAECRKFDISYGFGRVGEQVTYGLYGYLAVWGDTAVQLRNLGEVIDAADLSYKDMKSQGLLDREPSAPFYAMFAKMSLPTVWDAHDVRFRDACRLNMDRVILALAAYRDRYGAYPESPAQLRSRLGWEIPKDPYGGGDFGYKRKGDGYILWSTGPDAENDGGVQNSGKAMDLEETGDWVWEMKK